MHDVIKHRTPKGALRLRLRDILSEVRFLIGQKAPSAKRCIKTTRTSRQTGQLSSGQKAPSAKRCTKTELRGSPCAHATRVRKHRAPNGALRLLVRFDVWAVDVLASESTERQKVH